MLRSSTPPPRLQAVLNHVDKAVGVEWLELRHAHARAAHDSAKQAAFKEASDERSRQMIPLAGRLQQYIRSTIHSHRCPCCGKSPGFDPLQTLPAADPGAPSHDHVAAQLSDLAISGDSGRRCTPASSTGTARSVQSTFVWVCEGAGCGAAVCGVCGGKVRGAAAAAAAAAATAAAAGQVSSQESVRLGASEDVMECCCGGNGGLVGAADSVCSDGECAHVASRVQKAREDECGRRVETVLAGLPEELVALVRLRL